MTTSFSQYAVESFDLEVVDYLLKPISFERFCKAISRFENLANINGQNALEPSFFVKEGDEFIKILVKDIDYIEGLKDYVKIMGKNYCLALKSLKSIEEVLGTYQFISYPHYFTWINPSLPITAQTIVRPSLDFG